jgi:hypothetical protein
MKNRLKIISIVFIAAFLTAGCAHIVETSKVLWGSSTRALEESRSEAVKKTFLCEMNACTDAILELTKVDSKAVPPKTAAFKVFLTKKEIPLIVIVGVSGGTDTTEVGLFFTKIDANTTRIEVVSLSESARINASNMIFTELAKKYFEAPQPSKGAS